MAGGTRHLAFASCYNTRDTGGYPTAHGRPVRWRALMRSDTLCRLNATGRADIVAYGVRSVIDIRGTPETLATQHPFMGSAVAQVAYQHLPIMDESRTTLANVLDQAEGTLSIYRLIIDQGATRFAALVKAIVSAPEGGVLIHCHAGKDRTGLAVALLLTAVGVPAAIVAEDYALSDLYLREHYALELEEIAHDPVRHAKLRALQNAHPETITTILAHIEATHGSVHAYLRAGGATDDELTALTARLLEQQ